MWEITLVRWFAHGCMHMWKPEDTQCSLPPLSIFKYNLTEPYSYHFGCWLASEFRNLPLLSNATVMAIYAHDHLKWVLGIWTQVPTLAHDPFLLNYLPRALKVTLYYFFRVWNTIRCGAGVSDQATHHVDSDTNLLLPSPCSPESRESMHYSLTALWHGALGN